jgi:hypothetical protein
LCERQSSPQCGCLQQVGRWHAGWYRTSALSACLSWLPVALTSELKRRSSRDSSERKHAFSTCSECCAVLCCANADHIVSPTAWYPQRPRKFCPKLLHALLRCTLPRNYLESAQQCSDAQCYRRSAVVTGDTADGVRGCEHTTDCDCSQLSAVPKATYCVSAAVVSKRSRLGCAEYTECAVRADRPARLRRPRTSRARPQPSHAALSGSRQTCVRWVRQNMQPRSLQPNITRHAVLLQIHPLAVSVL